MNASFEEEMQGWEQLSAEALALVENGDDQCQIKYGRRPQINGPKRLWPKEDLVTETV